MTCFSIYVYIKKYKLLYCGAIDIIHQLGGEVVHIGTMIRHGKQYQDAYRKYQDLTHYIFHL